MMTLRRSPIPTIPFKTAGAPRLSAVLLLVVVMAPSAFASTINVGGSVDYASGRDGIVTLTGDRGFTLDGFALLPESRLDVKLQCSPGCLPGTTLSLVAIAGGVDLLGQATLDGILLSRCWKPCV